MISAEKIEKIELRQRRFIKFWFFAYLAYFVIGLFTLIIHQFMWSEAEGILLPLYNTSLSLLTFLFISIIIIFIAIYYKLRYLKTVCMEGIFCWKSIFIGMALGFVISLIITIIGRNLGMAFLILLVVVIFGQIPVVYVRRW